MASLTVRGNPYIIGPPIRDPKRFFGRSELFSFIRSNLHSGVKVILLHGQRRIGKSSTLAQIPTLDGLADFVFASLDLQYVSKEPLPGILYKLGETITAAAEKTGALITPLTLEELQGDPLAFRKVFLPRVFAALNSSRLILLLDEFDVIDDLSAPAVSAPLFDYLRTSLYEAERLYLIAVIGRRVDDLGEMRSLFKEAPAHEIGLLDRESAFELIRKPAQSLLEFDDSALDAVLELSSGHPYFTQLLAYAVFQRAEQRQRFEVQRADVEAVVDKAIESGFAGLGWFHSGLPIPERVVFAALGDCQEKQVSGLVGATEIVKALEEVGVVVTPDLAQALDRLEDWRFVTQHALAGKPVFRVTVELVRRWMVRYHPLRNEIKALDKMIPEADEPYTTARKSRADDETTYTLLRQVLALNPNHFSALSDAAALAFKLKRWRSAEAAAAYERLYKSDPTPFYAERFAIALVEAAKLDLAFGDLDSAQRNATDATRADPENSEASAVLEAVETERVRALAARNPFIVGPPVPPHEFTGRRSQIGAVQSAVIRGGHVVLFGERRMGKTSLLQYLASSEAWRGPGGFSILTFEQAISGAILPVYLDCSTLAVFSHDALWREVMRRLEKLAEDKHLDWLQHRRLWDGIEAPIHQRIVHVVQLARKNYRLLMLLDEFDTALNVEDSERAVLEREIRLVASESQGKASFVVATRRRPQDLWRATGPASPWYNMFEQVPVARLEQEEVSELMRKMPFELTGNETPWLRETAGSYPYLLSYGLSALFRQRVARRIFDSLASTTAMINATADFFENIWSGATAVEKGLLAVSAILDCERRLGLRLPVSLASSSRIAPRRFYTSLQQRGIIDFNSPAPATASILGSSLLEFWILQRLENLSSAEIDELEAAFRPPNEEQGQELAAAIHELATRQLTADIEPWTHPMREA